VQTFFISERMETSKHALIAHVLRSHSFRGVSEFDSEECLRRFWEPYKEFGIKLEELTVPFCGELFRNYSIGYMMKKDDGERLCQEKLAENLERGAHISKDDDIIVIHLTNEDDEKIEVIEILTQKDDNDDDVVILDEWEINSQEAKEKAQTFWKQTLVPNLTTTTTTTTTTTKTMTTATRIKTTTNSNVNTPEKRNESKKTRLAREKKLLEKQTETETARELLCHFALRAKEHADHSSLKSRENYSKCKQLADSKRSLWRLQRGHDDNRGSRRSLSSVLTNITSSALI